MIFKNSQKDWNLALSENRKKIIIKMSGGVDSTILAYLIALYKKEERPNLELYIATLNSTPPKNWHSPTVKRILKKITELTGVTFEKHYIRDLKEPGFDDTSLSTEEWQEASPYPRTLKQLVGDIKKEIQIDNLPSSRPLHFAGVTKNPPKSISTFYEDWYKDHGYGNWIKERDADTIRPEGEDVKDEHWRTPFTNIDKRALYEYYVNYNILEDLFPLTRSCESYETAQKILDGGPAEHCGKCWWCLERQWAFGRLI